MVARAKTVIIATGGAGRMHYQGFPTSNHYGATADGLVLGYRAGAKLLYADTLQYHPTGAAFPQQIFGALVTEKVRSLGAKLVNRDGEVFMHPLETRDVAAASIIRECSDRRRGRGHRQRRGRLAGHPHDRNDRRRRHHREARIPAMMRMFAKYGIDIRKEPILVYPTLHYQNGGLDINVNGMTTSVENLYVAGEAVGGIHGRNRLMGNSLLDIIVFGRSAGQNAAAHAKEVTVGKLTLDSHRRLRKGMRRRGHRHHRRLPQAPPRLPQAGLKPCTHLCAAMPRRVLVGYASWPGFYRRGTTGATARRSGAAPGLVAGSDRRSATGLMARGFSVISCLLACTDRHSATGLMARNEGQRGFQNHAGLWRGRASHAAQ